MIPEDIRNTILGILLIGGTLVFSIFAFIGGQILIGLLLLIPSALVIWGLTQK